VEAVGEAAAGEVAGAAGADLSISINVGTGGAGSWYDSW